MFKKVWLLYFLVFGAIYSGKTNPYKAINDKELEYWVDSVYNSLNETQRLGQLFNIAAYSNQTEKQYAALEDIIVKYNVGGLTFILCATVRQAILTIRYQADAQTPLPIPMSAETGVGLRVV